MPTKKDRVGTKGGKKSKSAYEKRQGRHGRGKEEQECLQKKDMAGTERREEAKSAYQRKKGRHGERKEE